MSLHFIQVVDTKACFTEKTTPSRKGRYPARKVSLELSRQIEKRKERLFWLMLTTPTWVICMISLSRMRHSVTHLLCVWTTQIVNFSDILSMKKMRFWDYEQRKAVKITQKEEMGRYRSVAHKQAKKSQDNRFEVVVTPINRGSWSNHDGDARSIKRMDL